MENISKTVDTKPRFKTAWRNYWELCKLRVVLLMLITAYVGMALAVPGFVPWRPLICGLVGIGLLASSAAVINHLVDRKIDAIMWRTKYRPIATGKVKPLNALLFSLLLGISGFVILLLWVNTLTAILTAFTLVGYAIIYTMFLKHATPQNIVIGGLAGAMPPLLGWTAVTGTLDANAWLLVIIIFIWTPPHFWALAIYRLEEYKKAHVPMLPVTHGVRYTKISIVIYTVLLLLVSILPFIFAMSGLIYLVGAIVLGLIFLFYALRLLLTDNIQWSMQTFRYSIIYLFLLFIVLFADHFMGSWL
jgi:protoheme IX farnesyltransferase